MKIMLVPNLNLPLMVTYTFAVSFTSHQSSRSIFLIIFTLQDKAYPDFDKACDW